MKDCGCLRQKKLFEAAFQPDCLLQGVADLCPPRRWKAGQLDKLSRRLIISFLKLSFFIESCSITIFLSLSSCLVKLNRSLSCFAFLSIAFRMSFVGRRNLGSWSLIVRLQLSKVRGKRWGKIGVCQFQQKCNFQALGGRSCNKSKQKSFS